MQNYSNLGQLLAFQGKNFSNKNAFNFKENDSWRSFSNKEFMQEAFYIACGLKDLGLQRGDSLAICSYQNPIWLMVDFATILAGGVSVPIFDNISDDNLQYQLQDSAVKFFFSDNQKITDDIVLSNPNIKIIGYNLEDSKYYLDLENLKIIGQKIAKEGKYKITDFIKNIKPQDLATIIYTSGSTGRPKGVEITHNNLISQIKAAQKFFDLKEKDRAMSFLPLAHILERMVVLFYISRGVSIYFTDNIQNIGNLVKEVKPNLMTTVPRLLEKIFAKMTANIEQSNFIAKFLAKKAFKRATTRSVNAKKNIIDKLFDRIIYKKLRQALGGNIKMIICGGAHLSNILERFYHNIGINVYVGYGLTETSPVLAANCQKFYKFGTVGKPFVGVELKIANDSELLAKGPNIMRAYHNQPEKTAEIMEDNWLKTGDLAQIDDEGFVKIIGRKKELFKTANGKYVSPVPIEQQIIYHCNFLIGSVVIAEGKKFVSALLFPDFDNLDSIKSQLKFSGNNQEFLKSQILQDFVEQKINLINQNLDHWQNIQKFHIIDHEISINSGEITPSMKLKRKFIEEKYDAIIADFYN